MKTKNQTYRSSYDSWTMICGLGLICMIIFSSSCKKDALDIKPNKSLVIPTTMQDFQGILDYVYKINYNTAAFNEMSSDDYYLPYTTWQSLSNPVERNVYVWEKDTWAGQPVGLGDWNTAYYKVFSANVVLEGLNKIPVNNTNQAEWNNVRGQALFLRAFVFYQMAQEFAKPYVAATANTDLGIPLRLKSDPTIKSVRSTVAQTYNQIINDLKTAEQLLPVTPLYKTRASIPAADALLARVYLVMGNYDQVYKYANSTLTNYSTLIDYNTLSPTASYPFKLLNDEVIYHGNMGFFSSLFVAVPDTNVYRSYDPNDLRKTLFYRAGGTGFKGNYTGNISFFGGIATDEVYLMRAEASARLGNTNAAMNDLNTLLRTRWLSGSFVPYTAVDPVDALDQILAERRKELMYRGTRWTDLRRLNQDSRFAITLTRSLNGKTYTLPPNDLRYTLLIPPDAISLSGMQQNLR